MRKRKQASADLDSIKADRACIFFGSYTERPASRRCRIRIVSHRGIIILFPRYDSNSRNRRMFGQKSPSARSRERRLCARTPEPLWISLSAESEQGLCPMHPASFEKAGETFVLSSLGRLSAARVLLGMATYRIKRLLA